MPHLCRGFDLSLSEWHIFDMPAERHVNGMSCVNQTRPHCVNQNGKTQSKSLPERHDGGTAWERYGMCESSLRVEGSWYAVCCWQR
jgi:hypothetical protein